MADPIKASQVDRFKRVARELGCDEDEARFNERLKRIAREGGKKDKPAGSGKTEDNEPG